MLQTARRSPFRLVYSLGEHPYLGFIMEPHIVQLNGNGSYSLSYRRIFSNTIGDYAAALDANDYEIIKLLDEMEQTQIIKKFHKKAIRPADYFSKFFDQKTFDHIRVKIDQKLIKVLQLIGNKPLFMMSKDGYPAEQRIQIAEEPASVLFHFRRNSEETRYFPTIKFKDARMEFMFKEAQVIVNQQAWLLLENKLYHFDQHLDGKKLSPFLNKRFISVPRATERKYFETFVSGLIEKYNVYAEGFDIKTHKEDATPILKLRYIENGESFVSLAFHYGPYTFSAGAENKVTVRLEYNKDEDLYTFHRIKRSLLWEEKQNAFLANLGLRKKDALFGSFVPTGNDLTTPSIFEWLNEHQEALLAHNFKIQQDTSEKTIFIGKTSLEIAIEEGNDWFDVKAFAIFGPYEIAFVELRDHILNRIREFVLPNGEIAIIPEAWFAQYNHLFQFSLQKDSLQLNKTHIGILFEISEHTQVSFNRKLEKLLDFQQIEDVPNPIHFKGELRPYQKAGYNWFHFLQQYNFGGCLADDMGLGKTVQTLSLLQQQKEALKNSADSKTSLLILPTSLVYNWQKEADKFAPQLRILLHTGSNRVKDAYAFTHFDLIITTYGIIRSDEQLLSTFFFNYIILDESQNIKNPTSKSFKAIKLLKSRHKLALSGTPIENSVADIWSQMHFTNPGLLGSYTYFQKEFVAPIEKKKDEDKARRLQAIIKPFILRRTKNQVATELPPKTEQTVFCEMSEKQAETYERTKSEYRNILLENAIQQSGKGSQIALLQGLTKLRQLANHPKMTDENYMDGSGKFEAVLAMLATISLEGNKVLIFSQFVKHLQLFRDHFDKQKIKYAYLDGSTSDRAAAVAQFKENEETKVFLISIKAGGVGLNLTEADYVFILDPWWNPAVEQQAVDRSHRIGQTKNVFIYKFISKDTVEEKILALQNRKKALSSALITTEESFIKSLSNEDIRELLK